MKNQNIDYKIRCTTPIDYELKISFDTDAVALDKVWSKTKKYMLRKKAIDVTKHDPSEIKSFKVPQAYYKYIRTLTNNIFSNVANIFKKDGVVLLSNNVTDAVYTLNEAGGWKVTITYEGKYTQNEANKS